MSTELADSSKLIATLQNSLYSGAKAESIEMVLSYCREAKLDPMQKPVHIVPMSVKNPQTNKYEWRDIIMPGIGMYRIQASRSAGFAGISEPFFGDDIIEVFPQEDSIDSYTKQSKTTPQIEVTYPKLCKVTVKRVMSDGTIAEFTATEFWKENYATAGKGSNQPNAMWKKRPYGQLAKCAEAQALRKAFPEVGQSPTAEEMEGKSFDTELIPNQLVEAQVVSEFYPDDQFKAMFPSWEALIVKKGKSCEYIINKALEYGHNLSEDQKKKIREIKEAK